jgi:hypothetical protein
MREDFVMVKRELVGAPNVMKQAANLHKVELDNLLPGVTLNTSPTNYYPIGQIDSRHSDRTTCRWP